MTTDHTSSNGGGTASHAKLALLLRECADCVERNEFHADMYQALGMLHTYAGQHANNPNNHSEERQISPKASGSFDGKMDHPHLMSSIGKKFTKLATPLGKPLSTAHPTTHKHAEHVGKKAEVGHRSKENDWCDEHFCLGCQCKQHEKTTSSTTTTTTTEEARTTVNQSPTPTPAARVHVTTTTTPAPAAAAAAATTTTTRPSKPAFQRPVNPNSILIANGWIEQQRRSKMRVVWKDVLASLVEGRKPGEETTLWIQREVINAISGKAELEALHQIPIKWLTSVEYLDYSTDHRFSLKVYNVPEEFLFKCVDAESAQNWVLTLRSVREVVLKQAKSKDEKEEEKAPEKNHRMTISELRAIAHGAGISTAGMERRELEQAVANIAGGAQSDAQKQETARREEEIRRKREEAAMEEQRRRGQAAAALEEKRRKQEALEEAERRQRLLEETERRKRAAAEEAERKIRMEEERRRNLAQAEEELKRRNLEEERRRQAEEELRRRKLEEERRRQAEEELRRRKLEEEHRLRAEEEARRLKAAEEEQRRRAADQQAAEQRRRQEEAQRQRWQQDQQQQQQWQQRQQQQRPPQQQWQQQQQQQQRPPPQAQWQQQQGQQFPNQPQPPFAARRPASPPGQPPPPPHGAGAPNSPVNQKYAKMAAQDGDDGRAVITVIKHNILIHWALQPPLLQMLRPIDILITTIHNVFPPAFGVPGHEYFSKWKAIHREALIGPGQRLDEEKLKKSVRKLRFFLHPDKLPRDLNDEQSFMCKMLWDVTSDAWEEFEKHKEELDWIRG